MKYREGATLFPWLLYLPLIRILVLSREASSVIFWVFNMIWAGIEYRSAELFANTLPTITMGR